MCMCVSAEAMSRVAAADVVKRSLGHQRGCFCSFLGLLLPLCLSRSSLTPTRPPVPSVPSFPPLDSSLQHRRSVAWWVTV